MQQTVKQMREHAVRQAKSMRNKARVSAIKRKEEYLGARVPKELRDKVIAKADTLGIPVSILIRNILEEAFKSVRSGSSQSGVSGAESEPAVGKIQGKDIYPTVIGWEVMTLNRAMTCTRCGKALSPGSEIALGLASAGAEHVILCRQCKSIV